MHRASRDLLLVWQFERAHNQHWLPPTLCTHARQQRRASEQAGKTVLLSITLIKCCAESAWPALEGVRDKVGGGERGVQIMGQMEHSDGSGTQSGGSGRGCF